MPTRSENIVLQVLGLVSRRLQPEFPDLMKRCDVALRKAAQDAVDFGVATDLLDSRQVLARGGDRLFAAFMSSLQRQAEDAWSNESRDATSDAFPDRLQPLRLLDDDIVDEDAALAGIAARHEPPASLPLMLMGQRFGVLLERPPLTAAALPVGPHAVGRALRDAAREIGLGLHARLTLYRIADLEFMGRYPALAEAVDATLDRAGILGGLSYVPLRPSHAPSHPARGSGQSPATERQSPLSHVAALRIVNQLLDESAPAGSLPSRSLPERREAVAALVRLVLLHGVDSPQWTQCVAIVREVTGSAREGRRLDAANTASMRKHLALLGYSPADMERLAAALSTLGVDDATGTAAAAAPGVAAAAAGARERRWQERLEQLPKGTIIGFTGAGGIRRATLRGRDSEHGLLLVNEDNGHEATVEAGTVAQLMADGHAWIVRGSGGPA